MSGEVRVYHLATGERIIAEKLDGSNEAVLVCNPMSIVAVPNAKKDGVMLTVAPYILGNKMAREAQYVEFMPYGIVCSYIPSKDILKMYDDVLQALRAEQSGIILPGNMSQQTIDGMASSIRRIK